MDGRNRLSMAWLLLACGTIGLLLVVAALPAWVQAQSSNLPPRPPTATPIITPIPPSEKTERRLQPAQPAGAWIELHCQLPAGNLSVHSSELWTSVQWQDSGGRWHDVKGWRGNLGEVVNGEGMKVWWVAEKDFGTGPFRWVVRRGHDGERLAESEPFDLPVADGETVRVSVVLAQ